MIEMTDGMRLFLIIVMLCQCLCMLGGMIRAALGPRFTDRVVAVNLIGTAAILILCVLSYFLRESYLVDVAILYALLDLVAVVVLCRIARVHHMEQKGRKGEQP